MNATKQKKTLLLFPKYSLLESDPNNKLKMKLKQLRI